MIRAQQRAAGSPATPPPPSPPPLHLPPPPNKTVPQRPSAACRADHLSQDPPVATRACGQARRWWPASRGPATPPFAAVRRAPPTGTATNHYRQRRAVVRTFLCRRRDLWVRPLEGSGAPHASGFFFSPSRGAHGGTPRKGGGRPVSQPESGAKVRQGSFRVRSWAPARPSGQFLVSPPPPVTGLPDCISRDNGQGLTSLPAPQRRLMQPHRGHCSDLGQSAAAQALFRQQCRGRRRPPFPPSAALCLSQRPRVGDLRPWTGGVAPGWRSRDWGTPPPPHGWPMAPPSYRPHPPPARLSGVPPPGGWGPGPGPRAGSTSSTPATGLLGAARVPTTGAVWGGGAPRTGGAAKKQSSHGGWGRRNGVATRGTGGLGEGGASHVVQARLARIPHRQS